MIISTIFANLSWLGWLAAALLYVAIAILFHFVVSIVMIADDSPGDVSYARLLAASVLWPLAIALFLACVVHDQTFRRVHLWAERIVKRRKDTKLAAWRAEKDREHAARNVRVGGEL